MSDEKPGAPHSDEKRKEYTRRPDDRRPPLAEEIAEDGAREIRERAQGDSPSTEPL